MNSYFERDLNLFSGRLISLMYGSDSYVVLLYPWREEEETDQTEVCPGSAQVLCLVISGGIGGGSLSLVTGGATGFLVLKRCNLATTFSGEICFNTGI